MRQHQLLVVWLDCCTRATTPAVSGLTRLTYLYDETAPAVSGLTRLTYLYDETAPAVSGLTRLTYLYDETAPAVSGLTRLLYLYHLQFVFVLRVVLTTAKSALVRPIKKCLQKTRKPCVSSNVYSKGQNGPSQTTFCYGRTQCKTAAELERWTDLWCVSILWLFWDGGPVKSLYTVCNNKPVILYGNGTAFSVNGQRNTSSFLE